MNTKEKLLLVTFEAIYVKGYYSTSIDKILKIANINKGSMYHYFKSKKELVLAVIDAHIYAYIDKKYSAILNVQDNYIETMFKVLNKKDTFNFTCGCRLNSLVQELSHQDEDFKKALERVYFRFEEVIKEVLQKAINNGEIKYHNVESLAIFVVASIEGCLSTAKKSQEGEIYISCIEHLENYFKTLR